MPIHYIVDQGIATFTIDNAPVNAFTPSLYKDLLDRVRQFLADREARVGILTGAGSRAFSAGHDIKSPKPVWTKAEIAERYLRALNENEIEEIPAWEDEVMRLSRFKPIVGAVNAAALGQGLMFLLHLTDLRVAAASARFGFPEIRYGYAGASGITQLGHQIPHVAALWMVLTGESFDAEKALHYNLINEVVPDSELMDRARAIARKIAAHPPVAVRVEMEAYYRSREMTREQALAFSSRLFQIQCIATQDGKPIEIWKAN